MGQTRKSFLIAGAAGAAGASTVSMWPQIALGAPAPIRIGAIPPITGANALLGQQGRDGVEFGIKLINARKGKVFDDRPFEMVMEDATGENQTAVAAMNKLVTQNVDAIVLPVLSTQIQAMAPTVKASGIPWMTGGTAVKNTQLGLTNLFRCRPSDGITASALTNFAVKDLKKTKIAILHSSEAFGVGGADQCEAALKRNNLTAALNIAYPIGQKDFTPEFLKIKSAGADAIVLYVQNPSDTAIILAGFRQANMGIPMIGSPSLANEQALETAKANANGAYAAIDYPIGSKKSGDFSADFERQFHHLPEIGTGSGWVVDAIVLIADTMRKLRTTDKGKLVEALHAVKGWEGIMGSYNCDAEGNMLHEIGVVQIVDQKPKLVKRVSG